MALSHADQVPASSQVRMPLHPGAAGFGVQALVTPDVHCSEPPELLPLPPPFLCPSEHDFDKGLYHLTGQPLESVLPSLTDARRREVAFFRDAVDADHNFPELLRGGDGWGLIRASECGSFRDTASWMGELPALRPHADVLETLARFLADLREKEAVLVSM